MDTVEVQDVVEPLVVVAKSATVEVIDAVIARTYHRQTLRELRAWRALIVDG